MRYLLLSLAVSGCVTQGTFDAMQADRDAQKAALDKRTDELAANQKVLANEQSKAKQYAAKIAELEAA